MIRPWKFTDAIQLFKLIRAFLESQQKLGWDAEVCEENVQWYWSLAMQQVARGEPHLVLEENGQILSYIQLGACQMPLRMRTKTAELFAIYTVPEARQRFLSIDLVRAAAQTIVDLGYKSIYSTVFSQNDKMIQNMLYNPAIWPTRIVFTWNVQDDAQFEHGKIVKLVEKAK